MTIQISRKKINDNEKEKITKLLLTLANKDD